MKIKYVIISMALVLTTFAARAQKDKLSLNLNYNYSFPLGTFRSDVVKDASPRGFTGNLMYSIRPEFSAGLGIGYQDYYQKYGRQLYNTGKSQQVSAVVTNSLQMVPVMARAEYSPLRSMARIQPYLVLAAGANFINNDQYLGEFVNGHTTVGFRALAGVGVKVPLGKMSGWGIDAGGSYDFAPYNKFGIKNLNTANVHAGIYLSVK